MRTLRFSLLEAVFERPFNKSHYLFKVLEVGGIRDNLGDRWCLFSMYRSGSLSGLMLLGFRIR